MKPIFKITLILLLVWPKVFFGQTYFNMLYPPEPGTWGSGTQTIVVTNTAYYMNRWAVDDTTGMYWHGFTSVELDGQDYDVKGIVFDSSRLITPFSLIAESDSTFVDVISIKNYNPTTIQYGFVRYDSLGTISTMMINNELFPSLFLSELILDDQANFISVGTIRPISGSPLHERYALMIKSDNLGNEIWRKTYSIGSYIEQAESVALCTDGGFIIGGAEKNINGPDNFYSPIVIKTDSNGNVEWKKKYGSTQYSNWPAYGITQTQDGGFAFCGGVGVNHNSNIDKQLPWVVKLDSLGNILWADTNSGTNIRSSQYDVFYRDIIELNDGSLVVCGQQKNWYENKPPPAKGRLRGVIKKLSASGTPIWTRYYSHPEIVDLSGAVHFLYDIDPTPDGGFVAAGWASYTADGTQSTWVIKVDSFGCLVSGCEVNSVPTIQPPIAELKVYPNPANEILNIEITPQGNQQEFVFEMYDILGKRVIIKTLYPFENSINVSNLPSGVYTYKIGSTMGKIVKQF